MNTDEVCLAQRDATEHSPWEEALSVNASNTLPVAQECIVCERPLIAHTPTKCGKHLLLQSTARASPVQLMQCQHWSGLQVLRGAAQHKPISCRHQEMPQSTLPAKRLCRLM